jgi:CelD/BcsL family acetyltransferase involved in cellulose biosynthesis
MTSMGRIAVPNDRTGASPARPVAASAVRAIVRPAIQAVDDLAAEWRALADRASEPNPFAEHWFVAASLPTMGAASDIRLLEVRRSGALIGLLPLEVARGYARLPVAIVHNWCHHHMFLGTPLIAAGEERTFWGAALDLLDEADWAPNLLHLRAFVEGGPVHLGLAAARPTATVLREHRALLDSALAPEAYYEQAVRQKKRKEIRRLRNRLAELGEVRCHALADRAELALWCDAYLAIEAAGWKGKAGTALAGDPRTARFFRDAVAAAFDAGRLQFLRLDLAGAPIAMLVNFLTPPGSFSFKTVFDEAYARFSPGVLIQLENLRILNDPAIAWMDSCAVEDHPMIDGLWTERRAIVRLTIRLAGARRGLVFALCRALEKVSALVRGRL